MSLIVEFGRWIVYASLLVLALKLSEHVHVSLEILHTIVQINAMLFALLGFFVSWLLISTTRCLKHLFRTRVPDTSRQRQQIIANYEASVQCVFEGRYQKALQHVEQGEQLLNALALENDWTDRRVLFKLIATRAALLDRKFEYAEQLLEDPLLQRPTADVARCLMGAQVALERKQPTRALEYLDYLEHHQGLHRQAYQLKLRALQRAGQWARIHETVQAMLKRGFIEPVAATHLERVAVAHLIRECEPHPKALQALWNLCVEDLRHHPDLLQEWLERAESLTEFDKLAWLFKEIERSLEIQWDDALWTAYALHPVHPAQRALSHGEHWLLRHPKNTRLLYGLGELCTRLRLWGKARSYLEATRSIQPDRQTTLALIRLYQAEGDFTAAENLMRETIQNELSALQSSTTDITG